ncbi:hypothetical protein H2204_009843 [Knufia peltigerae]|uniref:Alpha/beta hydrolase fold-3 domain-containing protein n=1 Tax=Knufia peltigerae TaxID=1002370 RepID=A0AA38XXC5_9EURO|nr:hypothetical protein H2204_009843 [Knufia peltigerae]
MSKQALQLITQPLLNAIPDDLTDRLDPVYVEYYNKYNAGRLHTHQIPIETFRANPLQYVIQWGRADGGEVFRISEQKCPVNGGEISIRIFEPGPADDATTPRRPLYINYHGGGFTFGDLEMDDPFCRRVCREVGCVAFDVEYRLSPDYRYPIPLEDCFAALKWIQKEKVDEFHLDTNRTAIGGVSAGGHLSAVLAHLARDEGVPLAFQLLVVPGVDMTALLPNGDVNPTCPYKSFAELVNTPALPVEREWKINPIKAPSFRGLAQALVVTAELDPLREEGQAYVEKLREAGVPVEHIMYPRVPHPFMMHDAVLEAGKKYQVDTVRALKDALHKKEGDGDKIYRN